MIAITRCIHFWNVQFWFNGKPHGSQILGVEVGVWGDTKEVEFCKAIVVLGEENPLQPNTTGNNATVNEEIPLSTPAIVSATVVIIVLAGIGIAVKRKRNKQ